MTDKQLTFRDNEIIQILNKVYLKFKEGLFQESVELLEKALAIDFEYNGVSSALKCANFWLERMERLTDATDSYERGEILLSQWLHFMSFIARIGDVSERCIFNIKYYVFNEALVNYMTMYNEYDLNDADILLRMGRCQKGKGNFESAIELLQRASQQKRNNAVILAELADCYSLINEERAAKVFLREAFFINPGQIELPFLESSMILRLVNRIKDRGIDEPELFEWIPVYATIFGLFNIKRELKPLELGKLKQSIYTLEKEIEQERNHKLVPRLINHYFWLIDHYLSSKEERIRIDEVLQKIKTLDPHIYKEYTH